MKAYIENFNEQWQGVERTVLSEVRKELQTVGAPSPCSINSMLQSEVGKWNRGYLAHGMLVDELRNEDGGMAASFLERTATLQFKHDAHHRLPSEWPFHLLTALLTILTFLMIGLCFTLPLFSKLVYSAIFAVVVTLLTVPWRRKRKEKAIDAILDYYRQQLEQMKARLVTVLRN